MDNNIYSGDRAAEPVAMTYGMSDELLKSDLLQCINHLSLSDKQCLVRYISEQVEVDSLEGDEWDQQNDSGLEPYTLDELYARIEASEEDIRNGKIYTEQEVREELRREFLWLK